MVNGTLDKDFSLTQPQWQPCVYFYSFTLRITIKLVTVSLYNSGLTLNSGLSFQPWGWLIDLMTDYKSPSIRQSLSPWSSRLIKSFPVVYNCYSICKHSHNETPWTFLIISFQSIPGIRIPGSARMTALQYSVLCYKSPWETANSQGIQVLEFGSCLAKDWSSAVGKWRPLPRIT